MDTGIMNRSSQMWGEKLSSLYYYCWLCFVFHLNCFGCCHSLLRTLSYVIHMIQRTNRDCWSDIKEKLVETRLH